MVLMDIAVAHGIMTEEDMLGVMKGNDIPASTQVEHDTIEQLEEKRK
jgi:hypothetical protein